MKPGESGEIKVTFDSKNKLGKVTKTVTIYSNDKVVPIKKILVHANVVPREKTDSLQVQIPSKK